MLLQLEGGGGVLILLREIERGEAREKETNRER